MKSKLVRRIFHNTVSIEVITALVITLVMVYLATGDIANLLYDETENTLRIINQQVNNFSDHPMEELKSLRDVLNAEDILGEDKDFLYESIVHSFYYVDIVDQDGTLIDVINGDKSRIGFDYSNNEVFRELSMTNRGTYIGSMYYSAIVGEPTLPIGIVQENHYIIGYLDLSLVSKIFDGVALRKGYIAIVDSRGTYISHTENRLVNERAVDPYYKDLIGGEIKAGSQVRYLGESFVIHYRKTNVADMYILYYQDTEEYRNATKRMTIFGLFTIVIVGLIAFLILYRMSMRIRRSFDELFAVIGKVREGDYMLKKTEMDFQEFDSLLQAFFQMSEEIVGRESEILELTDQVEENYYQTVVHLAKAIEAKDTYTGNHCERVTDLAQRMGEILALPAEDLMELRIGGALHDIGKISIPENILNKPSRLTNQEFALIQKHPTNGYEIIKDLDRMTGAKEVILYHHEKYDGSGYPVGLQGEDIPLLARIVMISDAYDAMTSERPYRSGHMTVEEALQEIRRCAGSQFDPILAEVFCEMMENDLEIKL